MKDGLIWIYTYWNLHQYKFLTRPISQFLIYFLILVSKLKLSKTNGWRSYRQLRSIYKQEYLSTWPIYPGKRSFWLRLPKRTGLELGDFTEANKINLKIEDIYFVEAPVSWLTPMEQL